MCAVATMSRAAFYIIVALAGVTAYMAYMHYSKSTGALLAGADEAQAAESAAAAQPAQAQASLPPAQEAPGPQAAATDLERFEDARAAMIRDQDDTVEQYDGLVKDEPITVVADAPREPPASVPKDAVTINGEDELATMRADIGEIKRAIGLISQKLAEKPARPLYETFFS